MRIGNPSLRRIVRRTETGAYAPSENAATYKGVYLKAALYALVTVVCAVVVEFGLMALIRAGDYGNALSIGFIILGVSFIPLLALALIIAFVPSTAKVLGFFYAGFQGLTIGLVSLLSDLAFPGVAFAALLGTMIVFFIALVVNSVFKVRVSSKFLRGLMIVFISLIVVQLIMWILSLFNVFNVFSDMAYFLIEFVICAICIIWAALMLYFDIQNIEYIVGTGADKKYEWYVSFSLVSTLIYMYVQILELLVRVLLIFGNRK